ncbi:MAG: dihydroorotase [Planctomycetaceae bacterium]
MTIGNTTQTGSLLIRGGRVIDPSTRFDAIADVYIENQRIHSIGTNLDLPADRVIDATGMIVSPGFIDPHVKLGEPGCEEDETIDSGTAAAVAGGFTTIAALPDTTPVVDSRAAAEFVSRQAERADRCHVVPLGAVTRQVLGEELSEIGQLVDGGAVGFTDGKRVIANPEIMRRALQYAGMFDRAILHHPQSPELTAGGVMHDGYWSTRLGLRGIPAAAEEIVVRRDIALAEHTGGRIHLMSISSLNSVDEVCRARRRGVRVSADVSPQHLLLSDESLKNYESCYKVSPPLRTQPHIEALIAGLKEGTIDILCADHLPWAIEKTDRELDLTPFGIPGLETLLPMGIRALIEPGHLSWIEFLSKLTTGPAALLGLDTGRLQTGAPADITILDPQIRWQIDATKFHTLSRNTPFDKWDVQGKVQYTIVSGSIRYPFNSE